MKDFNELTRVQIPALVHLTRLGYTYFGKISEDMAGSVYDPDTNILIEVFRSQFSKLNPGKEKEFDQLLATIKQELDNDDLGRSFYNRLKAVSPIKLIDYKHPENNLYHFTAEYTCKNGQDEFRPDITLFVNGLPLVFVEVKKPNNHGGIVAESERMNERRFPNKKFRRFINITQLMIFSNNMEYDTLGGIVPVQGAFYCTAARKYAPFNCFREENRLNAEVAPYHVNYPYWDINPEVESKILNDFNVQMIYTMPEYKRNKGINTPTNRILTSMCNPERLLFILKYGIAYVDSEREVDGKIETISQKHIMRYQQLFGALAIRQKLDEGVKAGIVWHTQGSGKTALSYYLTSILSDYYADRNIVAKFYFIVDRLDLLEQATQEFEARGLKVATANTKKELMEQFRNTQALEGSSGQSEITVVNIQRFAEDKERVRIPAYATNLQRIFILDEAHRGYKPGGCFLANLFDADENAIKIALTGTPLLGEERASCKIFGSYLHTYYYDRSISDGYTLKIIREDIETSYKERLNEAYDKVQSIIDANEPKPTRKLTLDELVQKREVTKAEIVKHPSYINELLRFIINDLKSFRQLQGDDTLGGMVICETSDQARALYAHFDTIQTELNQTASIKTNFRVGLILHNSDDKESLKQTVKDFKKNMTVDILIVFNMLLTGFDAPRLKRLYFGRKLKDHNLLQALTRVNRPYKNLHHGYVIDFADIKRNFEATNEAYLQELNRFNDIDETGLGNDTDTYTQIFENPEELIVKMKEVRQTLFEYPMDDAEAFSSEISTLEDKQALLDLKHALETAKDCINLVRTFGDEELKEQFARLDIPKLPAMLSEVNHAIDSINQKEAFKISDSTKLLINEAMLDIQFTFSKIGEEELKIIGGKNEINDRLRRAFSLMLDNIDQDDPEFITLREAFAQRFKERGFTIDSIAKFNEEAAALDEVIKRLNELRKANEAVLRRYNGDAKFARVHKRIREENRRRAEQKRNPIISTFDEDIVHTLMGVKRTIDQKVYDRSEILKKDAYFSTTVLQQIAVALTGFPQVGQPDPEDYQFIEQRVSRQYLNQYNATYATAY
ncbi:MAG: HsdR family type I site-specific deoxyribonuclease [Muribaculaceae bacterium]|nr:HsdR family type I site-specific deoxyribonuclease [Muribaculaceae bacterium]